MDSSSDQNTGRSYSNQQEGGSQSSHSQQTSFFQLTPYLSEGQRYNLKQYKYAGGDRGLMYIYFYNPMANWIVEYLPDTLAPNTITLCGFLFSVIPFFVLFLGYGT